MPFRPTSSGLILKSIKLSIGNRTLISMDEAVAPGEVLTVMGESGSGKSTLLDFVAGFLSPTFQHSGQILLNGTDITHVPPQDRNVGLMFQTPRLFPHMSVLENLLFALPREACAKAERRSVAKQALEEAGLAGFETRDPATLSGGQQTRVALMRVLLSAPKAILLDEPFSSLDKARRADIRALVFNIAKQRDLPVLLVTHDNEDAEAAGGKVITL